MSAFHTVNTVHVVLKARILQWFAIPFSSEPHFVRMLEISSKKLEIQKKHFMQRSTQ